MLAFAVCSRPECTRRAVTGFDFCLEHLPDPVSATTTLVAGLRGEAEHRSLCLDRLEMSDIDLSGHRFRDCVFSHAIFSNVDFSGAKLYLCFFDFAAFIDCKFLGSSMKSVVFSCATISGTSFAGSDMLHSNFNGIQAREVDFSDSDLYFSTFVGASLNSVAFVDCNLKKVRFGYSDRIGVNFRYSNYQEADFTEERI